MSRVCARGAARRALDKRSRARSVRPQVGARACSWSRTRAHPHTHKHTSKPTSRHTRTHPRTHTRAHPRTRGAGGHVQRVPGQGRQGVHAAAGGGRRPLRHHPRGRHARERHPGPCRVFMLRVYPCIVLLYYRGVHVLMLRVYSVIQARAVSSCCVYIPVLYSVIQARAVSSCCVYIASSRPVPCLRVARISLRYPVVCIVLLYYHAFSCCIIVACMFLWYCRVCVCVCVSAILWCVCSAPGSCAAVNICLLYLLTMRGERRGGIYIYIHIIIYI